MKKENKQMDKKKDVERSRQMKFNDEQLEAITSEKALILVSAGAGSGKTRVLTERFIHLCELRLQDENHPAGATADEIVAITFTEKAAREMKDRVRKRLTEKEKEATEEGERIFWSEQKEAMERAHISTFHSFCQRLLSQHAMTADLIPNSRVIDDVEARSRKRDVLTHILEEKPFHDLAFPLLQMMGKNQLFESIEKIHDDMREFIVGENLDAYQIDEMLDKQRVAIVNAQSQIIHYFHDNASRCIRDFPALEDLTKAQRAHVERITESFQTLTVSEDPNVYMNMMKEVMPTKSDKRWSEKAPALYELFEEYWKPLKEMWKDIGGEVSIDPQARDYLERIVILLKEFASRYRNEKKAAGALDFSDLQQKAVALLQHQSIKETCQKQFRHMMIDEFQDTNRLQLEMLDRVEPSYQFIVGDQKQSIYRFRGADVSLMNEREELAKTRSDAQVILMNQNYRTAAPVIEAVNELFSHAMVSERKESYETVYASLEANRLGEQENEKRVELTILEKDEEREINCYDVLANRILEMINTGNPTVFQNEKWVNPSWGDVAILIPARSHLLTLERSLINREIPYVVSGGVGFYERQEILDYLTFLRWLNRPFEELYLLALLRSPICGLSIDDFLTLKSSLEETESLYQLVYNKEHLAFSNLPIPIQEACHLVQSWLDRWTPFRTQQSLHDTLESIFTETGLRTALLLQVNGLQKVRNVEKLIHMIVDTRHADLETILTDLEDRIALSEKEGESEVERVDGDVVQIMTVHASKGLEFPIVCLPQLDRQIRGDKGNIRFHPEYGIVLNLEEEAMELEEDPIVYQTPAFALVRDRAKAESREEAKRLFYVAMTRARDFLYMIGSESSTKDTWLTLTEEALEHTNLQAKVERKEESEEQSQLQISREVYKVPQKIGKQEIPLTLSVSEIMVFMKEPIAYFNRFVIGLPDFSAEENSFQYTGSDLRIDPSKLGTLVHRACELRDNGLSNDLAIEEALREGEEEVENYIIYQAEMKELMKSYSDELKQELGETIANEWAFVTNIEGADIVGEIDKIVVKNGKRHIIDFKTNRISHSGAELIDIYKPQLYLYKLAYEQETNENVENTSLFVFRDEVTPLQTLVYNKEEERSVREAIHKICELRRSCASKEAYYNLKR
jgi:ATP-dependent exoDNAse (exonuclease V) beta subunit